MLVLRHLVSSLCLILAVTASAQIVNCSSNDMGRHSCSANTSNGVRLQRQISGSPCVAGQTWGYERGFIWVDRGCRADFALNVGSMPPGSGVNVMRSCKNAVSSQRPNIPLAYIQVDSPRPNGASQLSNFRVQPPNGPWSGGYCDVFQNGRVNVVFNSSGGDNGRPGYGPPPGNGIDPHNAALLCKNGVSAQWPNVPLAYIQVNPPRVNGGSLLSTFRVQPPGRPPASGSCDVFKNGKVNIQYNR